MFTRSFEFFNGCRVCFYDKKTSMVIFGVIFGYEEHEDTVDIFPDTSNTIETVMKFDVYKYDNWVEKKPVRVKSESEFLAKYGAVLKSSEEAPMPPLYFTRKLPVKWDLVLVRACWIYCKFDVLPEAGYPTGAKLKTPAFHYTNEANVGGQWNPKLYAILIKQSAYQTIRDVFCVIAHEIGHQYVQVVMRDFHTWHKGPFDEMMGKMAQVLKLQKKFLTVIIDEHPDGSDDSTAEDMTGAQAVGGKVKTSTGQDVDLKAKAKGKQFWVMVCMKDMRLFAIRQTDLLKAKNAVSFVNNNLDDSWKAALYDAPYAAFEFFNSQTGFTVKTFNQLKEMSGVFIKLIHEDGKLEFGRDVVAQYVKAVPDYMTDEAQNPE